MEIIDKESIIAGLMTVVVTGVIFEITLIGSRALCTDVEYIIARIRLGEDPNKKKKGWFS